MMNALMHRDYQSNMPVRFYQYDDRIEMMNAGGLYGNARPENFPDVNDYRNPVVAETMKVLCYVNRFSRGVARVNRELTANGNEQAMFDFSKQTVFEVTVKQSKYLPPQVAPQVDKLIKAMSISGAWTREELQTMLGLQDRKNFIARYLKPAIAGEWVELTLPDKPQSRLQRYRLSRKGAVRQQQLAMEHVDDNAEV